MGGCECGCSSSLSVGTLVGGSVVARRFRRAGRYLFLNAIANQLRYPNSQTYYFSCVVLYLFAEVTQPTIQEQITRCVHRTHTSCHGTAAGVVCAAARAHAPSPCEKRSPRRGSGLARVLLERLIVNRPHPWGLLITFIELIKNPRYAFWGHPFTRAAPEIERLFDSVARSCMVNPNYDNAGASADSNRSIAAATVGGGAPAAGTTPTPTAT